MAQFIKCIKDGEIILLNMDAVKIVRRHERYCKEDVLEDYDGNFYYVYIDEAICCGKIPDKFIIDLLEE